MNYPSQSTNANAISDSTSKIQKIIDYSIFPFFLILTYYGTIICFNLQIPTVYVSTAVLVPIVLLGFVVERLRPERENYTPFDQSPWIEAANFVFNFQLGFAIASGLSYLFEIYIGPSVRLIQWPDHWPLVGQVTLACIIGESVSYWQHRLAHRWAPLWNFHKLHHLGSRLNLPRMVRFHFVDIASACSLTFIPVVVFNAPPTMQAWVAAISGVLGVVQHANIRMRTPAWLARVIATPEVHRYHHSLKMTESNGNFGTLTTIFDTLFGTFVPSPSDGPDAVGVDGENLPKTFAEQFSGPFKN